MTGLRRLCTIIGVLALDACYVAPSRSIAGADQPSQTQAPLQGSLVDFYEPTAQPDDAHIESGAIALGSGSHANPHKGVVVASKAEDLPGAPADPAQAPANPEGETQWTVNEQLEQFEQRIKELETGRLAQESATRTIIRNSLAEQGPQITDIVQFGGTIETLAFWANDFDDVSESDIQLDTAEIDFFIQPNDWSYASLIFEYDNGENFTFPTNEEDEVFIDRVNVREAIITIGNPLKYPLFMSMGRDVVPFGVGTGDPVTDSLTIVDPLTIEVFETREDFVLFGFVAPTYCPPPAPTTPLPAPPRVRPLLFNPLVRRAATSVCDYCACGPPTPLPPLVATPPMCVSPYSGAIYFYNGDTVEESFAEENHIQQMGGTLGYLQKGVFARNCIPWSFDFDVDVNSSVFDSNFLQFEYRSFLDQIGFVPGMAAHVKTMVGPTAMVLEWNGAITDADFVDDVGTPISIRPEAWQIQFAYQFDWNPTVEVIAAQGTYFVVGYSETQDLAGVQRVIGLLPPQRVGFVPEKRLNVGLGEWIFDNVRVAIEYSHALDYDVAQGGTGNTADAFLTQLTIEW